MHTIIREGKDNDALLLDMRPESMESEQAERRLIFAE